MSERNVKLFYDEMCKNEKLQNEIKEVLGGTNTESDKQALLNNIAKKYNFIFTSEEAKKFAENLSINKLSLDDLSDVSGGIGKRTAILAFTALTTLGSLGSAGAIVSHATTGKAAEVKGNNTNSEDSKSEDAGNNTTPTTPANKDDSTDKKIKIKKDEDLKKGLNDLDEKIQNGKNEINTINVNNNINTGGDATNQDTSDTEDTSETNESGNDTTSTTSDNKKYNIGNTDKDKKMELEKTEDDKRNFSSEIITADNINIFENFVGSTDNLNLLYRMTNDGANREAMQNKLRGHSNVVVLVKTNENKIFGGYTSCTIDYNDKYKCDNKAFLFSIDLYEKFNVKEYEYTFDDIDSDGIKFGYNDLVLFGYNDSDNDKYYSFFGNEGSYYENNGITRDEFCGGKKRDIYTNSNYFIPVEIEVFEVIQSGKEYSSKIITNDKNKEIFENICCSTDKMKLAYRMSEDEKINSTTITNIKNLYNNIILIKTKKGNIFGGYITKEGEKDKKSFIFSIDNPDYFNYNKDSKDEIILNINEIKLGKDLFISLNKESKSYLSIGKSYNSSRKATKDIIPGEKRYKKIYFEIEEIELFNTNENRMNQILPYSSEIINNEDSQNIFEELICKTNKLQLLYRMTKDGANREAMKKKLKGHSNVVVLVKTNENKIFGGYTNCTIEYFSRYDNIYNKFKIDNKAFLFSMNLNKKFNIREGKYAIFCDELFSFCFGGSDLVLFNSNNMCYSFFGDEYSQYENNGITIDEICGGKEVKNYDGTKYNEFAPNEIEVFEIMPSGKEYSSNIITNYKDKETFENILTDTNKIKLAYRMSEDEKNNNKLIKNISIYSNNIILIKTKDGNKFGCYFRNRGTDIDSFIFSIDKPDYFNYNKDSKDEIILNSDEIKLGKDLFITLNKENKSYLSIGNSYNSSGKATKDIISGEEKEDKKIYFEIEEIEIFNTNESKMNQILPYSSKIINADNKDIFESLVSKTNKLQLLYRMTRDGGNNMSMQDKLDGHSNIVVLVKTDEGKIFGGYTSCRMEYRNLHYLGKKDKKAFLYSIDLNKKFNIKEDGYAISRIENYGFGFGTGDLILFKSNNMCVSCFGKNEHLQYENNGITRDEFCGGTQVENRFEIYHKFIPIEIEAFEIKEEAK